MKTFKKIQLVKKDQQTNRFLKNEGYYHNELRDLVFSQDPGYFNNLFLGKIRRKAVVRFLDVCSKLTDLDKPGKSRLNIRDTINTV